MILYFLMCFLCYKHFCRLYWIFSLSLCIFAWLLIISSLCLIMLYWIHSRMLKRNSQRVLHCLRTDFRREVSSSHYTFFDFHLWMFAACVWVSHACSAFRDWQKVRDAQILELGKGMGCRVAAKNQTWVFYKSNMCS